MRLFKLFALLVFATAFFVACKSKTSAVESKPEDHHIRFKFVQINDVYEIAPVSGGAAGGMARVAHLIDSIRAEEPNTYLMHAGDFLNPSLLGSLKYNGERIRGKQMIEVMNAMNFELVAFGNHEFDNGEAALQARIDESNFYWISANVFQQTDDGPRSFHMVRDGDSIPIPETYVIHMEDQDGTKADIGLFSVCIPSNPKDFVYYADMYTEANTAVVTLELQAVDAIVGLTHVSIEQDTQIAKNHPQIAHIMGGHEHFNMNVQVGNTRITKADANAKTVYVHTFDLNTKTGEMNVGSQLVSITDRMAENEAVAAVVDKWQKILEEQIESVIDDADEVVYHADPPLIGLDIPSRSEQTNLGQLITQAMTTSFSEPTTLALVNGGSIRIDDNLGGDVSALDIFRVLPFGGGVLKVKLEGELLSRVLAYGVEATGTGAYLHRHGFEKDVNGQWMANGVILDAEQEYTVAVSDFLMTGLDIPFLKTGAEGVIEVIEPKPDEAAVDIRKAIISYLKAQ